MPDIEFNCPHCKQSLTVDETGVGLQVNCPGCGKDITVPQPPQPSESLQVKCSNCGFASEQGASTCFNCGWNLKHATTESGALAQELPEDIREVEKSLRADPSWSNPLWVERALLWEKHGNSRPGQALMAYDEGNQAQNTDPALALRAYMRSSELDPSNPWSFNNWAWMLATSPNTTRTDGENSVKLAEEAVRIGGTYWSFLGTLAAAHARAGNFDEAVRIAELALGKCPENERNEHEIMLMSFRQGKAWEQSLACPSCTKPIQPDDVICVHCGLELKTGSVAHSNSQNLPQFKYEAMDRKGKVITGVIDAENEEVAHGKIKSLGVFPTKITPVVDEADPIKEAVLRGDRSGAIKLAHEILGVSLANAEFVVDHEFKTLAENQNPASSVSGKAMESPKSQGSAEITTCPRCHQQFSGKVLVCCWCRYNFLTGKIEEREARSSTRTGSTSQSLNETPAEEATLANARQTTSSSATINQNRMTGAIIGFIIGVCVMNWGVMLVGVKAPIHQVIGLFQDLDKPVGELNELNQKYSNEMKQQTGEADSTCIPCCTVPLTICSGAAQGFFVSLLLIGGGAGAWVGSVLATRK